MPAALTHTHRPMLHRLQRQLRIWWLRFEISSAEQWIKDCAREGIHDTDNLVALRFAVQQLRVQLAIAEAS